MIMSVTRPNSFHAIPDKQTHRRTPMELTEEAVGVMTPAEIRMLRKLSGLT